MDNRIARSLCFLAGICVAFPMFAQPPPRKSFDVPEADAAVSLSRISGQADADIVFLPDEVHGITTNAVFGQFTVPEALDRLVANTPLRITQDRLTGAFAVSRQSRPPPPAEEAVVQMRSYIVASVRIDRNPWRYAALPGIEILTRAPDYETYWILHSLQRGLWVQNMLLPPECPPVSSVPATIIIDDVDLHAEPREMLHSHPLDFQQAPDAATWGNLDLRLVYGQVESSDGAAYAKNINVYGADTRGVLTDSGWRLRQRLREGAPPLPEWFISGLIGEFGLMRESFAFVPGTTAVLDWGRGLRIGVGASHPPRLEPTIRKIVGPGTLWLSLEETARLRTAWKREPAAKVPLLPLRMFFGESGPAESAGKLWASEAGLFARWSLAGPGAESPAMAAAFARLLHHARTEPVTERLFSDCYGFGFAAMEAKLETYLRTSLGRPVTIEADFDRHPLDLETPDLEPATGDQTGRILGDWLRMKGNSLRTTDAALSEEFLNAAGRILVRAFIPAGDPASSGDGPVGERPSPQSLDRAVGRATGADLSSHALALVAVFGLCENDRGDEGLAGRLLEAAVDGGVGRPQAYFALGRLRFDAALARPLGPEGRLTAAQSAAILEPLLLGRRVASPDAAIYRLMAATWMHSAGPLAAGDRTVLEQGVSLYPRDSALSYEVASALAGHGWERAAALVLEGAERFGPPAAPLATDIEALRKQLAQKLKSPHSPENPRGAHPFP